jgi:hypothetical protein
MILNGYIIELLIASYFNNTEAIPVQENKMDGLFENP